MPFVEYFKNARVQKAKRAKALRGRPEWQDKLPDTGEAKETFRIAAKYQDRMTEAILKAIRDMLTDEDERRFKRAFNSGSIIQALNTLPFFNEGETDDKKVWRRFVESVDDTLFDIVKESGEGAMKRLNQKFKTDLGFTMESTTKAKEKLPKVTFVPINPYSVEWVENHALELAKKTLSATQRAVVSEILEDSFSRGLRAETTYANIKANIGLNQKGPLSYRAVRNREALHRAAGLPETEVKRLTDKYRNKLLRTRAETIARTETITANAEGRNQAWKVAEESGVLPQVIRRWITAPGSENPNRPCPQCESLDGAEAKLNEPYESSEGPVMSPPAHPGCRCTETMMKA